MTPLGAIACLFAFVAILTLFIVAACIFGARNDTPDDLSNEIANWESAANAGDPYLSSIAGKGR